MTFLSIGGVALDDEDGGCACSVVFELWATGTSKTWAEVLAPVGFGVAAGVLKGL